MASIHKQAFTMPRPWSETEIADLLQSPLCFALHEPDSFVLGRVVAGEAELLTVAVRPAAQGNGIGLRLVQGFLTEVARRGADSAFLEVAQSNLAARAVYAKAGFQPAGRRRGYYHAADGTPVDALVMLRKV